jgi:hypothetical protein
MSLKRQLESPTTPLRQWIDAQPLRLGDARAAFVAQLRAATPLLPAHDGVIDWTLLGNASGLGVVWHLDRSMPPAAENGARYMGPTLDRVTREVVMVPDWFDEFAAVWSAGPTGDAGHDGALDTIAGVFEQFTRRAYVAGEHPIHDVVRNADTWTEAMSGIPEWIAVDVSEVSERGAGVLGQLGPLTIGPSFGGSPLVGGADADFIAEGVLWDVKSSKTVELRARDIHQLLGYALLDFDDASQITEVAICSSRFGVTQRWPVDWLLGRRIAEARAEVARLLTAVPG